MAARGLEIDLAQAIAGRLGIARCRFVQEPRFAALFAPGPKPWDFALAQATITRRAAANVDFSVPYLRVDQGVLLSLQTARPAHVDRRPAGLRLCAQKASTGADLVTTTHPAGPDAAAARQRHRADPRPAQRALRGGRLRRARAWPPCAPRCPAATARWPGSSAPARATAPSSPRATACAARSTARVAALQEGRRRTRRPPEEAGSPRTSRSCPSCARTLGPAAAPGGGAGAEHDVVVGPQAAPDALRVEPQALDDAGQVAAPCAGRPGAGPRSCRRP